MFDTLTSEQRSERMSRVRGKDTKPEVFVRSLIHRLGLRFRLHQSALPGRPDVVLSRHKKVILVHGCFWHRHGKCRRLSIPKSNATSWRKKFVENVRRDIESQRQLRKLGWKVLVIWECETRDPKLVLRKLIRFLL